MTHKFRKQPKNTKRGSVSFQLPHVNKITFDDDVEITIVDAQWKEVSKHTYDGFTFLNSLIKKKLPDGKEYLVFKL